MKKLILTNKFVSKLNKDIKINSPDHKESSNETSTKFSKQINLVNNSEYINNKKKEKGNKLNIFRNEKSKNLNECKSYNNYKKIKKKSIEISLTDIKQSIIDYNKKKHFISKELSPKEIKEKKKPRNKSENYNKKYEKQLYERYNKYNISEILYNIDKTYSKINFNDKDFMTRMDNYTSKRNLRREKINEILEKKIPKTSKKNLLLVLNRLIDDSNRRIEANKKVEIFKKDNKIKDDYSEELSKNKSVSSEKWKKIYEERFKSKFNQYNNDKIKMKLDSEQKKKKNEEEELSQMKKYGKSIIFSEEILNEYNQRLYYYPITKKKLTCLENLKIKNQEYDNAIKLNNKKIYNLKSQKNQFQTNRNKSSKTKKLKIIDELYE
jgi:hypothetical protein